jgi:hypothetical protein
MTNPSPIEVLTARVDTLEAQVSALTDALDTVATVYLDDLRRQPRNPRGRERAATIRAKLAAAHSAGQGPPQEPPGQGGVTPAPGR